MWYGGDSARDAISPLFHEWEKTYYFRLYCFIFQSISTTFHRVHCPPSHQYNTFLTFRKSDRLGITAPLRCYSMTESSSLFQNLLWCKHFEDQDQNNFNVESTYFVTQQGSTKLSCSTEYSLVIKLFDSLRWLSVPGSLNARPALSRPSLNLTSNTSPLIDHI